MIRRFGFAPAALAAALLASAGLSSCDKFEPNEAAATVNGYELSLEQLEELAQSDDPTVQRSVLSAWIQVVAASEEPGELLTQADLASQREVVIPPLIEQAQEATQALYELGLDGSPALCLAVIPLAADVTAASVLGLLRAGASFAELAAQYSEDPSLIETGGVIAVDGQECLPTDQWSVDLIDQLTAERAVVGEPGVIELNNAEVIVLLRPYEELNDSSRSFLAQGPVSELLLEIYRTAEVTVHESIGTWDGELGEVVPSSSHE